MKSHIRTSYFGDLTREKSPGIPYEYESPSPKLPQVTPKLLFFPRMVIDDPFEQRKSIRQMLTNTERKVSPSHRLSN